MEVRGIGYTDTTIGSFGDWWKKNVTKVVEWNEKKAADVKDAATKVVTWNEQKAAPAVVDAVTKFVKVNTLWSQRAAFLQLVKINFRGFATRLSRKPEAENRAFWERIGGEWANFRDAIKEGQNKPYVFGIKKGEGARDESDQDFVQNAVKNYQEVTGENLNDVVYDITAGPQTGFTTASLTNSIGDPYVIAAYVGAAVTVISLVVPYLSNDAEADLQKKVANNTATSEDYEKVWRLKATQANLNAYTAAKNEGKSEAEAALAAAKAYADTMSQYRKEFNLEQTQAALEADKRAAAEAVAQAQAQTASSGGFGFNIMQAITDNPVPVLAITAFLFRKQIAKIFK